MGKLEKALQKVITKPQVGVRFDRTIQVNGQTFPSSSWTCIGNFGLAEANAWLVENLPALIEVKATRAELLLSQGRDFQSKHTVRLEELAAAVETVAADTNMDRMLGLWDGPELTDDQKEFLAALYKDYHSLGDGSVDGNQLFDKHKSRAHADIEKRLWGHPKAKDPKTKHDFLESLAAGEKAAMEDILYPSSVPGYAVDFAYEMWEKYFIDSVDVRLDETELEEKGLKEAEDEVQFLARAAASDGCQEHIAKLAKDWIEEEAQKWLDENGLESVGPEDEQ
jgi:hypothetical protein